MKIRYDFHHKRSITTSHQYTCNAILALVSNNKSSDKAELFNSSNSTIDRLDALQTGNQDESVFIAQEHT